MVYLVFLISGPFYTFSQYFFLFVVYHGLKLHVVVYLLDILSHFPFFTLGSSDMRSKLLIEKIKLLS